MNVDSPKPARRTGGSSGRRPEGRRRARKPPGCCTPCPARPRFPPRPPPARCGGGRRWRRALGRRDRPAARRPRERRVHLLFLVRGVFREGDQCGAVAGGLSGEPVDGGEVRLDVGARLQLPERYPHGDSFPWVRQTLVRQALVRWRPGSDDPVRPRPQPWPSRWPSFPAVPP